jgi:serine/threonine-protein kinase
MTHRVVAHFELLELLGHGAMGTVYKGRDLKLDREVAIKFIAREHSDEKQRARFLNEAKAASMLDHQNICTIYEIEETAEGELFIVMAYCQGMTLRDRLEQHEMTVAEAVDFGSQMAAGLYKAHSTGVVHRDIKPGNVMITSEGCVKIVDFGLAKVQAQDVTLTTAESAMGTVAYMSPEQIQGMTADHRSDIWSWGVTLFEMLCRRRPFGGASAFEVAKATIYGNVCAPSSLRPEVSAALDRIVLQALQKTPKDRQQSARELMDQLQGVSSGARSLDELLRDSGSPESIAVLPFVNVQSDPDSDYFSDGLTEELINALSRVPNLRVVSRTSAFEFKGKSQNISTIAQQLKVRAVVEGSVRKYRDTLRVTAHLVSADNGYCLWSEKFDRTMNDVFAIQDEIAESVAQALEVRLAPSTRPGGLRRRRTDNLDAYDCYLRGRYQWNKRSGEGLQQALECFEEALSHDPKYAAAYSGVADYHIAVASWGLEKPSEAWPKAKSAALRALDLDGNLAEAHASLGTVRMWCDWEWEEAEREFLRAIKRNPGHPSARIQYNVLLVQTGRFDEAEDQIRVALATDPLSIRANSYLAGVLHYRREYDRSMEQCMRTLELDPEDIELHVVMGLNYEQKKMFGEAIQQLEKARELAANNPIIFGPLGSCYAQAGERQKAEALLREIETAESAMYVAAITRAMIYLGLKDHDNVFRWLESAAESREVLLCYLAVGPIYDGVRGDSRYHKLLRQIGLKGSSLRLAA